MDQHKISTNGGRPFGQKHERKMIKMKKLLAIAALSLAAAPISATAQDVSREAAPVGEASNLSADGPTITALVPIAAN